MAYREGLQAKKSMQQLHMQPIGCATGKKGVLMQQKKLLTPAQYARLRNLNRSTISRQIQDGKIPAHGGLLDPQEADEARRQNVRVKEKESAQPIQPAAVRAGAPVQTYSRADISDAIDHGIVYALNQTLSAFHREAIAVVLLALGIDLWQVWSFVDWHRRFLLSCYTGRRGRELKVGAEPPWEGLAAATETEFDLAGWQRQAKEAFDRFQRDTAEDEGDVSTKSASASGAPRTPDSAASDPFSESRDKPVL
jgi:hypothetical protein